MTYMITIILFRPFGYIAPKDLKTNIYFSNLLTFSVHDHGYSRNGSCTLHLIFTFLLRFRSECWTYDTLSVKRVNNIRNLQMLVHKAEIEFLFYLFCWHDHGYSRNGSCTLHLIFTFLLRFRSECWTYDTLSVKRVNNIKHYTN
jgi:hypothetical protein